MNNLNITHNSNDLNESEKTQEKLYSNDASLDDILTYSEDISQNIITNKSTTNRNIRQKEKDNKQNIELSSKNQMQIIRSFNSEVTLSFLNNLNDNNNNITNKEYHSKSASKSQSQTKEKEKENKNMAKSISDMKSLSLSKSNISDLFDSNKNNNLKDIIEIHNSMSNILSKFEIKEISISRSINDNIKKNNSESKKFRLNNFANNKNCVSIRSENLFIKNNKAKLKGNNFISNPLNNNINQISEDHSNTNSMCNYQNISNLNEISNNKNCNEKKVHKKENNEKKLFLKNELSELSIKLNMSLDNCITDKKHKNDKLRYLDPIIDESEYNKKDIFTTSNKKENSFYFSNQNNKIIKNCLKYTKAQCINTLFQNNIGNNNEIKKKFYNNDNNKHFYPPDASIKTKGIISDKNNQKNNQKIASLSPHRLSFEIQKNDSIQISISKANKKNEDLNNKNKSALNNDQSSLSTNKANDASSEYNYFYNNECLKKNNTSSFMIIPNYMNSNKLYYQKRSFNKKQIYINNKSLNSQKIDLNFFYNPKNKIYKYPYSINNNINNNVEINENELHTPDLNKSKITPMTCVHKGSLVYCNDNFNSNNDNTIKINKVNNCSNLNNKKNNYSFSKNNHKISYNSNYIKPKKPIMNQEKKLVYLKNSLNKNNVNHNIINNSKIRKSLLKNKNNSFNRNINNNYFKTINNNKNKSNKIIKSKVEEKGIIKNKETDLLNIQHNSKIKRNLSIRNSLNRNNNSNNSIKNKKSVINKIKINNKTNALIDKINNDLIKESSLFSILYNNMSHKNTIKNNSRPSSNEKNKEEKESTIIHKREKTDEIKKIQKKGVKNLNKKFKNILDFNMKNKVEKKLIKHKTNNSFSIYNSFLEKALDESNKKNKKQIKNNVDIKNKNRLINKMNNNVLKIKKNDYKKKEKVKEKNKNKIIFPNGNQKKELHKKVNTQINLNALTSNFNFINKERRKNNKSLYNFGNIYFINQNHIIKNDYDTINQINNENNNSNLINFANKYKDYKLKENILNKYKKNSYHLKENMNKSNGNLANNSKINPLNVSNTKQSPKIIKDFSKYKKKGDYRNHFISMGRTEHPTLNGFNGYNHMEYLETQLISEN